MSDHPGVRAHEPGFVDDASLARDERTQTPAAIAVSHVETLERFVNSKDRTTHREPGCAIRTFEGQDASPKEDSFMPSPPAILYPYARGFSTLAITTLLLACGSNEPDDERDVSASTVREETREAYESAKAYAGERFETLERRAEESLERVDTELDEARSTLSGISDEARSEVQDAIDRAEQARVELASELRSARTAGKERWETSQQRLSAALDEIVEAEREISQAIEGG